MSEPKTKEMEMQDVEKGSANSAEKKKKKEKEAPPPKVSLATLFRFASFTEKLMILLGILGGFGHGIINPLFIQTFGGLIDSIHFSPGEIPTQEEVDNLFDTFNSFILILVYLAAGAFVASYFRTSMFVLVGQSMANKIRQEYVRAILRQEIGWFDSKRSGELSARLANDVPLIRDATSEKVGQIFFSIALFVAGYVIAFTTSWKVALVTLAGTPVLIITVGFVGKALTMYSTKAQKAYASAGTVAQEILSAIKTVMIFGGQSAEEVRYDKELEVCENNGKRKAFVEALSTSLPFVVGFSLYALALWYGSTLVYAGELTAGKVLIAFLCCTMSSSALGMMAPAILTISIGRGAAFEIFQVIDRQSKIDSLSPLGLKPDTCKGNLSFKEVKFTYPSRPGVQILKGISFDVPSGKTVALVGKSGSGKSTIVALLERFYDCDEGTVTLDGQNLKDFNVKWLRSRMGLVGQEPVLFAGTIAENIAINKENATMDEIVQAAKEANAHDFINLLPEGYNTVVMQKGGNLSGGQKQRVAIARALITNPQILLLDEATSALDSKSESIVQDALERASVGRTTVVIAHRLSTIKNADKILVFNQGEIIESGNHDELMALNGTYANMVNLQSVAASQEKEREEPGKFEKANTFALISAKPEDAALQEEKKKKQKKITNWYAFKKAWSMHWREDWYYNTVGLCLGILQGGCFPAFSFVFAKILLALMLKTGDDLRDEVNFYCIMLVVCGAGSMLVVYNQSLHYLISGERYTRRLRRSLFSNLVRQKAGFFDEKGHEAAVFETILAQDASMVPKMSGRLVGQFAKIISVSLTALGLGLGFCWRLSLVIFSTIPLNSIGQYMKVKSIKGFATETRKAYEKSGVVAAEAIENARTVLSLTLEEKFLDRFTFEIMQPEKTGTRDGHINGLGFGYGEAINLLVNALAFWYGGQQVKSGDCDIEGMFVTIMAVINTGLVIGDTLHIFPDFQQALEGAVSFFEYQTLEKEITGKATGLKPESCDGNVTFDNVRFAYPTRPDIEVLKGFSCSVTKGQTLALVGQSGCGKSTTVSLIERLYSYSSGSVTLDGNELNKLDIEWVRSQIGFVGQEPVVFARSIKENILYGVKATDEEVIEASKKANAHDFISKLPDGYNTYVGERGTQLSGGQKQRIAIARAIIRNPKILLLDEATSALDSESERLVQDAISEARKGRTTIVIAHRLSTIKDADIIAVVDKGKVVETGTHNELIEKKGHYFKYVEAQSLEHHEQH